MTTNPDRASWLRARKKGIGGSDAAAAREAKQEREFMEGLAEEERAVVLARRRRRINV